MRLEHKAVLLVFTSMNHLLAWMPNGCKYAELQGRAVILMARTMNEIDHVGVNIASGPRGFLARNEIDYLAQTLQSG